MPPKVLIAGGAGNGVRYLSLPRSGPYLDRGDDGRDEGDDDDAEGDEAEVLLDEGRIPDEEAEGEEDPDPGCRADEIVHEETRVAHLAYPRDAGDEGTDYRHEAGDNNCFTAMLFVKSMCALQIFFFKKTAIFKMKDFRADKMADGIINCISGNGSSAKQNQQCLYIQRTKGGKSSEGK